MDIQKFVNRWFGPIIFKMFPARSALRISAYHEAGHAVVGLMSGAFTIQGPITYVKNKSAGVNVSLHPDWLLKKSKLSSTALTSKINCRLAVVAGAGAAAETLYRIQAGFPVDRREVFRSAHGDASQIRNLYGPGKFYRFQEIATRMLQRPDAWQAVTNLARVLIRTWPAPLSAGDALSLIMHLRPK